MSVFNAWGTPCQVSFGVETTPGTEISPNVWIGNALIFNPALRNNIKRHRSLGSLQYKSWTPGKKGLAFSLRFELNHGRILYPAMGAEAVTGTGPYTHTLTYAVPKPACTVEVAIPNGGSYFVLRFIGSKVQKFASGCAVDGVAIVDMDWVALDIAKYTSRTTISEITDDPYHFEIGTFTLNSVALGNLDRFQWSLNWRTAVLTHLGQRTGNSWREPPPIDDVTLDTTMHASTWFDAWNAAPPTEMDADAAFVRTASSDELTFNWNDFPIESPDFSIPEEGEITQRLTLPVGYSTIEVIDSVAAYAPA